MRITLESRQLLAKALQYKLAQSDISEDYKTLATKLQERLDSVRNNEKHLQGVLGIKLYPIIEKTIKNKLEKFSNAITTSVLVDKIAAEKTSAKKYLSGLDEADITSIKKG